MEDSILKSIKKLLGLSDSDESFDVDLVMHINSALMTLMQVGVGPKSGFSITGEDEKWSDLLPTDKNLNAVKTLVYYIVRLGFDPPQNSSQLELMKQERDELEWRVNVEVETEWLEE